MLLSLFFFAVPDANAQIESAVQAFDEGNELYRTGNYSESIEAYEKAIAGGYASGALYYNIGNAYFRLDELGQAVLYYEKARLLTPDNPELIHNLEIAQGKKVDQFSNLPTAFWVRWWKSMTARTGGKWLFWMGLILYFAAVGIIIYRIKSSSKNQWLRRARAVFLLMGLILLVGAFGASMASVKTAQAVILVDQVDLREAPDNESNTDLSIHEGLVVDILKESSDWLEVRLPNGTRGWVPADVVGDI